MRKQRYHRTCFLLPDHTFIHIHIIKRHLFEIASSTYRRRPSHSTHSGGTFSETYDEIRDSTALLSDMLLSPSMTGRSTGASFQFPHGGSFSSRSPPRPPRTVPSNIDAKTNFPPTAGSPKSTEEASSSPRVLSPGGWRPQSGERTPRALSPNDPNRSILTMLLNRERVDSAASSDTARPLATGGAQSPSPESGSDGDAVTPTATAHDADRVLDVRATDFTKRRRLTDEERGDVPLLSGSLTHVAYGTSNVSASPPPHFTSQPPEYYSPTARMLSKFRTQTKVARQYASPRAVKDGLIATVEVLPAVLLGLLLNILDGVSYGFIMFPAGPVFAGFGSLGVSMFFVTWVDCAVSSTTVDGS